MNKTSIEYMDFSWNPLAMRCTPISAGCTHCWHLTMANRLAGNTAFSDEIRAAYAGERSPILIEERLAEPLHRKKPAVIGTQFMGDLFHPDVTFAQIWEVWKVMRECPQHTFLILTKRPERMAQDVPMFYHAQEKPLPNAWLGVTAENQATADERIPLLLQTPAAVRFISAEPLLGPVILQGSNVPESPNGPWPDEPLYSTSYLRGICGDERINWIIAGGESGPGARPMNPEWARGLRDQCQAAGVPFFFKSWGAWLPFEMWPNGYHGWQHAYSWEPPYDGRPDMVRVGKKTAGHRLDGQVIREWPLPAGSK